MLWPDDHGRMWRVEIDTVANAACGVPYLQDANPPIPIPLKYVNCGKFGKVQLEYKAWKRDVLEREANIKDEIIVQARAMYAEKAQDAIDNPPPALMRQIGVRPIPLEFIMAMEAGQSPWVLGVRRADGSLHPRPTWVTDELWTRYLDTRKTVYSDTDNALPTAELGEFADAPLVPAAPVERSPFADDPSPPETARASKARAKAGV